MKAAVKFGRFQVVRELGSGAMGQVFLATDPNDLIPVAVKLLKNPLPTLEARFKREFRVLQRLESPYVVRVLEFGEDLQGSYLVMEFIEGQDLGVWQGAPPTDADGLKRCLKLVARLASGLEHVHRAGVIHRDLKPENILVGANDTPKITDFGLARDGQASVMLTKPDAGGFMGTILYAPPEQIQGRELDHRADLYAFGMVLYRLLVGRTAFAGRDMGGLVLAHLREPPPGLRAQNPAVPVALEALVLRLLAKNPAERPDSAAQVQSELEVIVRDLRDAPNTDPVMTGTFSASASMWGVSLTGSVLEAGGETLPLLEPPFLGREATLGTLLAQPSGGWWLEGEAGVGKSRLLTEFCRERGLDGWRVLQASPSPGIQVPLEALRQWVRAAIAQGQHRQPEALSALLASESPILANLLPELGAATPLAAEAQYQLFSSALRVLGLIERPLLVLDAAERSDEGSLAFVAFALRSGLSCAIACRSDAPTRIQTTLKGLRTEGLLGSTSLEPLGTADSAHLVRAVLGGPCDEALIEHITARAQGNPWMTVETVRTLVASGAVFKRRRFWEWTRGEADLSPDLRETFEVRLQHLEPDAQALLGVAAVIGEETGFEDLLALSGRDEDGVLDDLEVLLRARLLLEERQGRSERYRFAHPLLRETALAGLAGRKRRRLHEKYAQMLLERPTEPGVLAHHHAMAGLGEAAAQHALEFARQAEAVFALADAEPVVRTALDALEDASDAVLRVRLELVLGRIQVLTGRSSDAEPMLRASLEVAQGQGALPLEREARLALAELYQRTSRWVEAIGLLEPVLDAQASPQTWMLLISCLRFAGRSSEALERADQAESSLKPDAHVQATLAQQRASALLALRRWPEAHQHALRSLQAAQALEHPLLVSRALVTLGRLERQLGLLDAALEHYVEARTALARIGDGRGEATVELNISTVLIGQKRFDETLSHLERALILAERGDYLDLRAAAHTNLFNVLARLEQLPMALEHAQEAVKLHAALRDAAALARAWYAVACAEVALGLDPTMALGHASGQPELIRDLAVLEAWWQLGREPVRACTILETLHESDPSHAETQLLLALAQQWTGLVDQACATLQTIPDDPALNAPRWALEVLFGLRAERWGRALNRLSAEGDWLWHARLAALLPDSGKETESTLIAQ